MSRLKICGITDADFAREAARQGVDYLGLIFAAASPRRVELAQARTIAAAVPRVPLVGVFTDASVDEIIALARQIPLSIVQLHGYFGADAVKQLKAQGLKVWRLYDGLDAGEDAVLLDGHDGARQGGTGKLADWTLAAQLKRAGRRVVLAGGISEGNIAAAVLTGADVIDVNSSLETAPGVKSPAKLARLLDSFQRAR